MKASDSTNSLTGLTSSDPSCFICLETTHDSGEPLVSSQLLRNCGCKFSVHPVCWNEWMKDKTDYDCPICRKDSMLRIKIPPNPVLSVIYQEAPRTRYRSPLFFVCFFGTLASILITAIVLWG